MLRRREQQLVYDDIGAKGFWLKMAHIDAALLEVIVPAVNGSACELLTVLLTVIHFVSVRS